MKLLSKLLFLAGFLVLGFTLKSSLASASTCMANATGNWNSAGTWANCAGSTPQAGDDVTATSTVAITLTVNVTTANLKSFDMTGLGTGGGTLAGSSNIAVVGLIGTTNVIKFAGTVSWTGTLIMNPANATALLELTTNGKLLTAVSIAGNATATVTLQDDLSFTAAKTDTLTLGTNALRMNGFTISGNSATNRLLVTTNSVGTQRTITRSSGAFANVDFRDIDLEAAYDCSAVTGLCGDAGGNSADFTFTTAADQHWTNADGGNWADSANWTSRVPLPQDNVIIDTAFNSAKTVTINMPRIGKDIDFTGMTFSGTKPIFTYNAQGTITLYGSLTLQNSTNMTWTLGATMHLEGRGSQTITSAGQNFAFAANFTSPGGSWSLQDALSATSNVTWNNGDLTTNNFNITAASFSRNNSNTVTYNLGTSVITVTGTSSAWGFNGANGTLNALTATIIVSNVSATSKTFAGGGYTTYGTVTFSGRNITVTGNNTIATLNLSNAGHAEGVLFTGLSTTTITTAITTNATTTAALSIATSTNASQYEIKFTGSNPVCTLNYMSFNRALGMDSTKWYVGPNSTNVGVNTNLYFQFCPVDGYNNYRAITIDKDTVASSTTELYTDFPVLVSSTVSSLATTGNGGEVTNSSGYDIIFATSTNSGAPPLAHELEKYTATNGQIIAHVKVPSLSTSTDTTLYMYYGNSNITTSQQNVTGTWNSAYKGVYHLADNAANKTVLESTRTATSSSVSNTSDMTAGGKINSALEFDGSTEYVSASGTPFNIPSNITVCAWAFNDNDGGRLVSHWGDSQGEQQWLLEVTSSDKAQFARQHDFGTYEVATGATTLTDSTWYYICGTYDDSVTRVFVNGVQDGTDSGAADGPSTTHEIRIAHEGDGSGANHFEGEIDEVSIANTNRTVDWLRTEWCMEANSASCPFMSIGNEVCVLNCDAAPPARTRRIQIL